MAQCLKIKTAKKHVPPEEPIPLKMNLPPSLFVTLGASAVEVTDIDEEKLKVTWLRETSTLASQLKLALLVLSPSSQNQWELTAQYQSRKEKTLTTWEG